VALMSVSLGQFVPRLTAGGPMKAEEVASSQDTLQEPCSITAGGMRLPWWIELRPTRRHVMKRLVLLLTTLVLMSAATAWFGED